MWGESEKSARSDLPEPMERWEMINIKYGQARYASSEFTIIRSSTYYSDFQNSSSFAPAGLTSVIPQYHVRIRHCSRKSLDGFPFLEISFQIKSALYPFRTSKPMPFSNIAKSVPFIHLANGVSTFFNFEDLQDCQI